MRSKAIGLSILLLWLMHADDAFSATISKLNGTFDGWSREGLALQAATSGESKSSVFFAVRFDHDLVINDTITLRFSLETNAPQTGPLPVCNASFIGKENQDYTYRVTAPISQGNVCVFGESRTLEYEFIDLQRAQVFDVEVLMRTPEGQAIDSGSRRFFVEEQFFQSVSRPFDGQLDASSGNTQFLPGNDTATTDTLAFSVTNKQNLKLAADLEGVTLRIPGQFPFTNCADGNAQLQTNMGVLLARCDRVELNVFLSEAETEQYSLTVSVPGDRTITAQQFIGEFEFIYDYVGGEATNSERRSASLGAWSEQPNMAPTAVIAGGNRTIADTDSEPGETVAFDGSGSSDPDGSITGYEWILNGQPVGDNTATIELRLADGENTVGLVVTDNRGGRSSQATATVTVEAPASNQLPTAVIAGGSRVVPDSDREPGEQVAFDGSGSFDPDGSIVSYQWSVNGFLVPSATGPTPTLTLPDGDSVVSLIVTDNRGLASDPVSVTITVQPFANQLPTARIAGGNRNIADTDGAPGEAVAFDGSESADVDGTVVSYEWSVNGQVITSVTGPVVTLALPDGESSVGLVVTDDRGARSAQVAVTITVEAPNLPPEVTIEVASLFVPDSDGEPGELVPFRGSAIGGDGSVSVDTFRWSVNGQAVETANGDASPVLHLVNGENAVVLTARDDRGAVGSATVRVTVGEVDELAGLPGVEGNKNLTNTAAATQAVCSAVLKSGDLNAAEQQLKNSCVVIYERARQDPASIADALQQISGQEVSAQQSTALRFSSAQMVNVGARLTALRQGARGFSSSGLSFTAPDVGVPLHLLASLGKALAGELGGGASGDDESSLLDDRLGIFINGAVGFGSKSATERESGFDFDSKGVTIGVDYRFTDSFVAGAAIGYGRAKAAFDLRDGKQDSDSLSGALYGAWYGNSGYVDGIASYGRVSYDARRNINLFDGAITDSFLSSTNGRQYSLGLSGGYDFSKGGFRLGPQLSLSYLKVDIDGFSETAEGTSGLAMAFGGQSADSLLVKAGGNFMYSFSRSWGVISPQTRFSFVKELRNDAQAITVQYATDPIVIGPGQPGGEFLIFTDIPDEYYFTWAAGVSAQFAGGIAAFVEYESVEGLDNVQSTEIRFGVRFQRKFR